MVAAIKQKITYLIKKLLGFWPPNKKSAYRLMYDLKDADEDYNGKHQHN